MDKNVLIKNIGSAKNLALILGIAGSAITQWPETIPTKRIKQLCGLINKDYLQLFGNTLIDNGYRIVPIAEGVKYPNIQGWEQITATKADVSRWVNQGFQGIGVIAEHTPGIDIDVLDEGIIKQLVAFIESKVGTTLKRIGKAPKLLIPFQSKTPFTKLASKTYLDTNGKKNRLEILSQGQQYLAFATHPETKQAYKWVDNESILTTKANELPILTHELAQQIIDYFESIIPETWQVKSTPLSNTIDFENVRPPINQTSQQLKAALKHIDADDRDIWIKVGMGLHHQYQGSDEGFNLWDNWSQSSHKYNATDTQAKWRSFKSDNTRKAVTAATIIALANHSKKQTFAQKIKDFYEYHYLVEEEAAVIDTRLEKHRKPLSLKEFNAKHRNFYRLEEDKKGKIKRIQIAEEWLGDIHRKSVTALIYKPSDNDFIFNENDNTSFYNTFMWPNHKVEGKPNLNLFYDHIYYLFPETKEAEWFINWIAFKIQEPHKRCMVTPLHISLHQGTGRGWLVNLLSALFGYWNMSKTDADTLGGNGSKSNFNDYLYHSLCCVVEEIKQSEKHHYGIMEKLKSTLTDKIQQVNIKYGKMSPREICYTNFFMMSNHIDAIVLREDDRRFNVFMNEQAPKDKKYYTQLYRWLEQENNIAGLFYQLKARSLKGFNYQTPMKNAARQQLIDSSKNELEFLFEEFIANPPKPWMTFEEISQVIATDENGHTIAGLDLSTGQLRKLLQQSPKAIQGGKKLKVNSRVVRPWCLDLTQRQADNEDIRYWLNSELKGATR